MSRNTAIFSHQLSSPPPLDRVVAPSSSRDTYADTRGILHRLFLPSPSSPSPIPGEDDIHVPPAPPQHRPRLLHPQAAEAAAVHVHDLVPQAEAAVPEMRKKAKMFQFRSGSARVLSEIGQRRECPVSPIPFASEDAVKWRLH